MSEFDRIFDSGYDAVDLFTNRSSEDEIFARSLENHSGRLQWSTATLEHAERNNILTFYGVGGIGKTELSRRLEKWVNGELPESEQWGRPPEIDQAVKTVRIDFHGSANVDAADIVLRLRAALAERGLRFPAFDIGVSAWWALAHPGVPMPDLKRSTGFDVKGQITDTLNSLIAEAGEAIRIRPPHRTVGRTSHRHHPDTARTEQGVTRLRTAQRDHRGNTT